MCAQEAEAAVQGLQQQETTAAGRHSVSSCEGNAEDLPSKSIYFFFPASSR